MLDVVINFAPEKNQTNNMNGLTIPLHKVIQGVKLLICGGFFD